MPIVSPPPAQPPAQPPVVVEKPVYIEKPVYKDTPSRNAADLLINSESTSNNKSKSSSDSSSVNSAQQSNVQINNNSNRVEVDGIKIPTTTLNLNSYYNNNGYTDDWGVVVGISASLDGKKKANRMLDKRIALTQLQYERELAGACASIDKDGYEINPNSIIATELAQCNTVIRKRKTVNVLPPEPPAPRVNPEIELLRKENAELRQQLALILQKLDNNNKPVNGGF